MTTRQISPTTLSLESADRALDAGRARAEELGVAMNIVVLDGGAYGVASARMDGAALAAIETSAVKARTAVLFAQPTRDLAAAVQPGAPLFTIDVATREPLAFVPGGVPVTDAAGRVIGAIGAGGGTPDQDDEVASAAATAIAS
jgi:uncharacterized protein GlcG (DUF336 family)